MEISKPSHLTTKKGKNANRKKKTSYDWKSPITSHKKQKSQKRIEGKITPVDPITIRVQTHSWLRRDMSPCGRGCSRKRSRRHTRLTAIRLGVKKNMTFLMQHIRLKIIRSSVLQKKKEEQEKEEGDNIHEPIKSCPSKPSPPSPHTK